MSKLNELREEIKNCMARAEEMYGVDLSDVIVRFDLKGAAAGMAGCEGSSVIRVWYLRFNLVMLNGEGYNHIMYETVPHEIAHMVCMKNPRLGRDHNSGWARVCIALGGTGKRCHSERVIYAKGKTYEYTCSKGTKVCLSEQRHKKIQLRGASYNLRTGGKIDRNSEYQLVGISGRPLTQPVNPNPQTKKVIDMTTKTKATTAVAAETETKATKTTVAAPKGAKATAAPAVEKALTKAQKIRAAIAEAKANAVEGAAVEDVQATVIAYAKAELEMKPAMAKRYVVENWTKA